MKANTSSPLIKEGLPSNLFPYPVTICDYNTCTETDVQRLLLSAGIQRQQKALRYTFLKGRWACLKVCEMLLDLWKMPAPLPDFSFNEYGKPFLAGFPDFSFSHCKTAIAVCTTGMPGKQTATRIGIDIETIRPVSQGLIDYTMNAGEQTLISSSPRPDEAFIRLWTKKEALVKCLGTGIRSDIKGLLSGNSERVSIFTHTATNGDYVLSMAVQEA